MDASTDGLVIAHGHWDTAVMLYVPDLLWRQQSKVLMNYAIYVYVMSEEQILV